MYSFAVVLRRGCYSGFVGGDSSPPAGGDHGPYRDKCALWATQSEIWKRQQQGLGPERERYVEMTEQVQNLENGFERKWTMDDVQAELNSTIATMATGSFNLIGVAVLSLTIGVYVDKLPIKDVKDALNDAMVQLHYGKSSRYALTAAAIDVGREFVKAFGHPKAETRNDFWNDIETAETVSDAVATVVARIRAHYTVETVQGLSKALKGESAPKAPKAEKAAKEDAPTVPEAPKDADIPKAPTVDDVMAMAELLDDAGVNDLMAKLIDLQTMRTDYRRAA